jgi:GrpB-like predicted nucleotidyltransferase (UPF0157 family)
VTVVVVEYDDAWPVRFTAEADQIRAALGAQLRRVEHVGSTAVPGLAARPIVDIAISVEDLRTLDVVALEALGAGEHAGFHVHVYELEPDEFMDHVRLRDYLRTHPEDRDAYGALKLRLAQEHDDAGYEEAKAAFVARLVAALRR